jgi:hypothetical protein
MALDTVTNRGRLVRTWVVAYAAEGLGANQRRDRQAEQPCGGGGDDAHRVQAFRPENRASVGSWSRTSGATEAYPRGMWAGLAITGSKVPLTSTTKSRAGSGSSPYRRDRRPACSQRISVSGATEPLNFWSEEDWIFADETGRAVNPRTDWDGWKPLLATAGARDGRASTMPVTPQLQIFCCSACTSARSCEFCAGQPLRWRAATRT